MSTPLSVIFDLDGTMIDTAPGLMQTVNVLLARRGRPALTLEAIRGQISDGARAIMDAAMRATGEGVSSAELDDLFKEFLDHYLAVMSKVSSPYPGLETTLTSLRQKGHLIGVCTNRIEKGAIKILREMDLEKHFSAIIGQDSVGIAKPDPAPVFETLKRMGGDASYAVFIGDSEIDIAAAQAANLPVIAVSFGYSRSPAKDLGADMLIDHYNELEAAISALIPDVTARNSKA